MPEQPPFHHDLCFGCGQANPFGLQLELERLPGGELAGRFFVKQDHQGPAGTAHAGLLAAALEEVIALAAAPARPARLEMTREGEAVVGTFVAVSARPLGDGRFGAEARAEDGSVVARAVAAVEV